MRKCSVCGCEIRESDGKVVALSIIVPKENPEYGNMLRIFGTAEFYICFVCWLTSLGVKRIIDAGVVT
jgi:hypothetical protein